MSNTRQLLEIAAKEINKARESEMQEFTRDYIKTAIATLKAALESINLR